MYTQSPGQTVKLKLSLLMILTTLLFACSNDGSDGDKNGGERSRRPGQMAGGEGRVSATPVAVATPELQTAHAFYETTAALEPESDAKITTRSLGVVRKILREEGDDVAAGEVLLQLEDDDQRLRVKQAEQKLENANREYNRVKKMRASGVLANNDYDAAEIAYKTAQTDLELAQLALDYTQIKAPFNGRVVTRSVDLGESVAAGTEVFRMMAINPLLIRIYVPATRIGQVSAGDKVSLHPDSLDAPVEGTVRLVSPIVDPTTGTIKVTIALEKYPALVRPGDFTRVRLATDSRENAMMVPSVALIEEREERYVFVAEAGKAIKRRVEIGFIENDMTEILQGLSPEEKVIIKGQRTLADDAAVEIKESNGTQMADDNSTQPPIKKKLQKPNKTARG